MFAIQNKWAVRLSFVFLFTWIPSFGQPGTLVQPSAGEILRPSDAGTIRPSIPLDARLFGPGSLNSGGHHDLNTPPKLSPRARKLSIQPKLNESQLKELYDLQREGDLGRLTLKTSGYGRPKLTLEYKDGRIAPQDKPIDLKKLPGIDPSKLIPDIPYTFIPKQDRTFDYELSMLNHWKRNEQLFQLTPETKELNKLLKSIPSNSSEISKEQKDELHQITTQAIAKTKKTKVRRALAESWYLQEKSYGGDELIDFKIFQEASVASLATCAIMALGRDKPHGSGVLIGSNLVLTVHHVFKSIRNGPQGCKFVFGHIGNTAGTEFTGDYVFVDRQMDVAVIEIDGPNIEALPQPATLGTMDLRPKEAIFVSGHPEASSLKVALNAEIVYPYWLPSNNFETIITSFAEDSLLHMAGDIETYLSFSNEARTAEIDFFQESYQPIDGQDGLYFWPQDPKKGRSFPTLAGNPDTRRGNSGSPVFHLNSNVLVGILRAGKPDDLVMKEATSYYFESIIPISYVDYLISKENSGWKQTYGVKEQL